MSVWMLPFRRICYVMLLLTCLPTFPAQYASAAETQATSAVYLPLTFTTSATASSEELIDIALQTGKLDAETALLYRVYAAHVDPRLPAEYRGNDSDADSTMTMREVAQRWSSLSAALQAQLEPFTLPPSAPDSWLAQSDPDKKINQREGAPIRIAWNKVCRTSTNIRVWYRQSRPQHAALAEQVCQEVENKVWPMLTELMGRAPLSDQGEGNNGGDEFFDIYLTDANSGVRIYKKACDATATYMLLNTSDYNHSRLAYSLMSAILFGYDVQKSCAEYDWNFVATAEWAKDYVYPNEQREHPAAPVFMANTATSLDGGKNSLPTTWWGNYVWNFFLARLHGGPQQISAIWARSEHTGGLDAVNEVIEGGFEESWPLFTRANWNRDPVDAYRLTDSLTAGVSDTTESQFTLNGAQQTLVPLAKDVPYLAARYYHFTFSDPSVRTLAFYNGFNNTLQRRSFVDNTTDLQGETMMWQDAPEEAKRGNHIRALVKINGTWSDEDWTESPVMSFCRSNPNEHIEELVLIFSNSSYDRDYTLKPSGEPSSLFASNAECYQWSGTARRDERVDSSHVEAWVDQAVFSKPVSPTQTASGDWQYLSFTMFQSTTSGPAQARASGTVGDCTLSGSGSGEAGLGSLFVYNFTLAGQVHRTYWGSAITIAPYQHTYTCPNDTHVEDELIGPWFQAPTEQFFRVQSDGATFGEAFQTPENPDWTFTWLFTAK